MSGLLITIWNKVAFPGNLFPRKDENKIYLGGHLFEGG
jgi:hypothetical protein